jgi:hypothetical protein
LSGVWTDRHTPAIEGVEDQQKFCVPLNRDTEHLFYNVRILIDNNVLTEPRAWHITKVNRVSANGISMVTLAQDHFSQEKDYIEKDENGNVIGMWADYWTNNIEPIDYSSTINIRSEVVYSGVSPTLKINGASKKFTVKFFNDETEIDPLDGQWQYAINGADASALLEIKNVSDFQVSIKFIEDDLTYIGKVLNVKYIASNGISSSVDVEIRR